MSLARAAAALLARVRADDALRTEREAVGWVVVVIDMEQEQPTVAFTVGLFPNAAQAASEAERMDAEDRRWDEHDWLHVVAPVMPWEDR